MVSWNKEQTLVLIEEYKKYEFLYKYTHPDHLKVYKKNIAYDKIVQVLKNVRPNITTQDVKKKIKVLHQQLAQEKKKLKNRSGMSADDVYVPTLWCFEQLSYILNATNEICGEASIDLSDFSNNASSGSQISLHSNASPTPSSSGSSRKRSRAHSEVTELRLTAQKSLQILDSFAKNDSTPTEEKREELFTKMICAEIKKFKYEETYDNFTSDVFSLLVKAKEQERRSLRIIEYERFKDFMKN